MDFCVILLKAEWEVNQQEGWETFPQNLKFLLPFLLYLWDQRGQREEQLHSIILPPNVFLYGGTRLLTSIVNIKYKPLWVADCSVVPKPPGALQQFQAQILDLSKKQKINYTIPFIACTVQKQSICSEATIWTQHQFWHVMELLQQEHNHFFQFSSRHRLSHTVGDMMCIRYDVAQIIQHTDIKSSTVPVLYCKLQALQ